MHKVVLVEEVGTGEVITPEEAEGRLWNSPPATVARYRLVSGVIDPETWARLTKQYWSAGILEEFDLFLLPPGWRFSGDAPASHRAASYEVEVVTKEELARRAGERRRAGETGAGERRLVRELARRHVEEESCGLVKAGEVCGYTELFERKRLIEPLGFWYASGLDFLAVGRSRLTGGKMVLHGYGNAVDVYCDYKTAEELFRRTWRFHVEAHGGGEVGVAAAGFQAMVVTRFYQNCHGAQAWQWIAENLSEQFLPLLREKCVVRARPGVWKGFSAGEAREVCWEFGILFEESPDDHGVFLMRSG